MTKEKAEKLGDQLSIALQNLMRNDVNKGGELAPIDVEFFTLHKEGKTQVFTFKVYWREKRGGVRFDLNAIIKEIQKLMPNLFFVQQYVMNFVNIISLNGSELGKLGSYRFTFIEIRP